jgi:hypothetical protein
MRTPVKPSNCLNQVRCIDSDPLRNEPLESQTPASSGPRARKQLNRVIDRSAED